MTQDIKGLIAELRDESIIYAGGVIIGRREPTRLELKAAALLESLLSRQPVEVEGVGRVQVVAVEPDEFVIAEGAVAPPIVLTRATVLEVWAAMLAANASAKEGESNV